MAKLSQTDSKRMYSWWWDSHISPKNSKWLQENLTDMDAKVKVMIKLIEEDADSFARRAEMYYKKRPELMRLVEEFYRAYRALAERYDHATGVIRHAHRTMTEAFPNQVPLMFADDSPVISGADPRTPDMSTPTRALSEENDISIGVPGLSSSNSHAAKQNGDFTDDSDSVMRRKALKQLKDQPFRSIESVQKGLNFDETEDKEHNTQTNENHHFKDGKLSKPDQTRESEEILMLKEALARLETEKEAGLVQYQKSLNKLSQLESEISQTREDFRVLRDHATKAENEAIILKGSLSKLETEKESKLQEYQQCVDRLSDLESIISKAQEDAEKQNQRASTAETEVQSFKAELDKLAVEKDASLNQYIQSLETISNLENKVQIIEEDAMRLKERAENVESEVELLKQTISKLTDEKEAVARQYQQCLETISSLEEKLKCAQEKAKNLNVEIDNGVSKLKCAEEQCLLLERSNQSLHSELESLMLKMGTQTQELTEKQQELGRLWACIQEERMRFVEAETAFQTLQHLHSQTQDELRSMASELQKRAQLLKVAETQNQSLQDEVLLIKEENKHLDELNASSSLSILDMQNEISILKESKEKLKEEIELRIDQRNALQQEIYCLKEELNDLNKKHLSVLEQVHKVGLNPESFGSSVRQLQEENSNIKEIFHRERSEKEALLGKLEIFEQLLEKNSVLETSLSDLNAELEAVRGKIEALEQSLQSILKEKSDLLNEKATLTIQLQETNKNMENLMENNTVVVNSLSDAHYQLEALKANSKEIEDSCRLLANEKAGLISEKDGLTSQLENTQIRLDDLGKIYGELEGRYLSLEKERESTLHKVEELQMSLDVERKERANYIQMNESWSIGVEAEMHLLHEECHRRKRELDEVLDTAISYEIEMFVLCRTAQELELNNFSSLIKNQKLLEESILSEEKISQLEKINFGQTIEIKSLRDQASSLRAGTYQLMKVLDIVQNHSCMDETDQDQVDVQLLLSKLQDMKKSLCKAQDENQQWAVELSILVTCMMQLRLQAQNLKVENNNIEHEFKVQTEHLIVVQSEVHKLLETNEELRSKLRDEDRNKEAVTIQIEDLCQNIMDMQSTCDVLQRERSELCEEKTSLMEKTLCLEEKNCILEEENCVLCGEVLALDSLSLIFRNCAEEQLMVVKELGDNVNELHAAKGVLMGKLSLAEETLEESEVEMLHLKERLQKSEDELKLVGTVKDQLSADIENGKNMLHQMELVLQEAEQKIGLVEKENYELQKNVEDLKTESNEFKIIRDDQENQIFELSTNNNHLSTENNHLHEAIQILEVKLHELHEEHNKSKSQEENLHFELKKKINEIDELEIQSASVFGELQHSMVCQLLFEQKFHELHETCLGYIDQNEGFKNQISSYGPQIVSLKECIASLENHTDSNIKLQNPEKEEFQGAEVTNGPHKNNQNKDERALIPDPSSDLQDLHARLQAIERASVAMKELMVQENMDLHSKLDASTRQVELLKSGGGRYNRSLKQTSEITEVDNALLTKDIMLDQISNGSSYGLSKREPIEMDNQTVELWETTDPDTVGKSEKILSPSTVNGSDFYRVQLIKEQKGEFPASDELIKKELSMDKLEISKRFTESIQEGNKRKVLERLDSDVQKLANLQITVQDLKAKLDVAEKGRRGKAVIECESLKGQLEEADIAIKKLFDFNGRLMKTIEDSSFSDVKSSFDLEGDGNARKKVSEQARRMSEKIGRLQLEVQKLQFILLKLDQKEGKTKISVTKRRILLRDYLYGGRRTGQGRRKAQFCGCVQPSTIDD